MTVELKTDLKEQSEICNYILAYLYDNPDAGDTFEGIVEWWVLRQRLKFETRNVSEAVKKLVAEGLIEVHEEADLNVYRVNRTKERVIRNMLTQAK